MLAGPRAVAWGGLLLAFAATTWAYGFEPLLRDARIVPAPQHQPSWSYWLAVVSFVVIAFGLSVPHRTWIRLAGLGLGLHLVSLASPSWIETFHSNTGLRFIRWFDGPTPDVTGFVPSLNYWATALVVAGVGSVLGVAVMATLGERTMARASFAANARFVGTGLAWAGVLAVLIVDVWGFGLMRFGQILASQPLGSLSLLAEGYWASVAGAVLAAAGLVLYHTTTAVQSSSGRWATIQRFIAPDRTVPPRGTATSDVDSLLW